MRHPAVSFYVRSSFSSPLKNLQLHIQGVLKSEKVLHLHQMRVSSRRLRNTLWIYKDLLLNSTYQLLKNKIYKLAKISSVARDLDVQGEFLNNFQGYAVNRLKINQVNLRGKLQSKLEKAARHFQGCHFSDKLDSALRDVEVKNNFDLYDFAFERITKRLGELLALEAFVDSPLRIKRLHEIRIAVKHLRYSLEVFDRLYKGKLKVYILKIQRLQQLLGSLHDFDVLLEQISFYSDKWREDILFINSAKNFQVECRKLRGERYLEFQETWHSYRRQEFWEKLTQFSDSFVVDKGITDA